ncbi:MAG: ArsR/SmtB family transcription factor [Acidimicrobiales bacterium]
MTSRSPAAPPPSPSGVGAIFAALADDTRRSLLTAVAERGTATATELAAVVPVSRQAVAKHLGVLRDAGLVEARRAGRETRYEARAEALRPAASWLADADRAWAGRLERLKRRVESPPT